MMGWTEKVVAKIICPLVCSTLGPCNWSEAAIYGLGWSESSQEFWRLGLGPGETVDRGSAAPPRARYSELGRNGRVMVGNRIFHIAKTEKEKEKE
ncbi:hypothetical protein B0H15DRAFT_867932 [Mycena belliarum]|uniref:Uncharacterized protein n=1 Tax=Mycena belliarum TaxID=1033014 RepID=A0AAD6TR65_9AGAR|nr:hypothetical protein B0H15DRAFT_867932 [Mycena belliae]